LCYYPYLPSVSYSFLNKGRKVLKFRKFDEKREITPKWVMGFTSKLQESVHQPTWPLLLKIEHMVKLQVLGNNSKTVNNIKNLTWDKNDQHSKIYLP
jgi:hypothetical protein